MTMRLQSISNPADITVNGQLGTGGINRGRRIINSPQIESSATEKIETNTNGLGRLLRYRLGTTLKVPPGYQIQSSLCSPRNRYQSPEVISQGIFHEQLHNERSWNKQPA